MAEYNINRVIVTWIDGGNGNRLRLVAPLIDLAEPIYIEVSIKDRLGGPAWIPMTGDRWTAEPVLAQALVMLARAWHERADGDYKLGQTTIRLYDEVTVDLGTRSP